MIRVTEDAKELFGTLERPEGKTMRLDLVAADQVGLVFGEPEATDQVVSHQGEDLLHIAGPLSEALDGATIDKVDTPQGPSFSIVPPDLQAVP